MCTHKLMSGLEKQMHMGPFFVLHDGGCELGVCNCFHCVTLCMWLIILADVLG